MDFFSELQVSWFSFLLLLPAILFFSLLIMVLLRRFRNIGTKNKSIDTVNRWNTSQKPTLGGIVFYIAFAGASITKFIVSDKPSLPYHACFFAGGSIAFALGLWDDTRRISAARKFLGQCLAASVFLFGLRHELPVWLILLLGFWIVGMMNSFNMFDNMDGVAATVAITTIAPFLFIVQFDPLLVFMLSALLAFLLFNWYPSKIFMGDSGSMLIGFVLATLPFLFIDKYTSVTGFSQWQNTTIYWSPVLDSILLCTALAIPLVDTAVVVINRLAHGRSPASGGKDHTTHNLSYLGISTPWICVIILTVGVVAAMLNFSGQRRFSAEVNRQVIEAGKFHEWRFAETLQITTPNLVFIASVFVVMLYISRLNLKLRRYSYNKKQQS